MVAQVLQLPVDTDGFAGEVPEIGQELGSAYGWSDRLFLAYRDGAVLDYGDWHARDLEAALVKDSKLRQIERVLCGPIEAAEWTITPVKGDTGEAEELTAMLQADEFEDGMRTPFDLVIAQMTSAIVYKKAFFELVFGVTEDARFKYDAIAFRPASTCRQRRTIQGRPDGFEQDPYWFGGPQLARDRDKPYIEIPQRRAFVYVHGQRRDAINGVSDLDVAYWCYQTKQKVLFLWFQFAETAAMGRTIVKAQDDAVARDVAGQVTRLKNGGAVPVSTPQGPQSVEISNLDVAGQGAAVFPAIVAWLDQAAANSVQAGFTNLTNNEKSGGGWALSADASDFFLQTRESDTREIEREVRRGVFAPLMRLNRGPAARIPKLDFEPLQAEDKSAQVTMLSDLMRSRDPALVPDEFIGQLAQNVAEYLGMDGEKVRKAFDEASARARAQAAAMAATPAAQQVAGVAGAIGTASRMTRGRGQTIPGITGPQLPAAY